MVFQDPYSSLNPRMNIEDAVAFNALVHGASRPEARAKAWDVLNKVGLRAEQFGRRYPHELSGGQRQRVNIARALVLDPKLVLLDEPVSSLDKSVQAQVLNLLQNLKHDLGLTYVFISHDLHVIEYLSDRVLVMYLGQIVEIGSAEEVSAEPLHPYTQALFASAPSMNPDERIERPPLTGDPPNPINPPSGCRFRTRCPHAMEVCASARRRCCPLGTGRQVACYLFSEGKDHSPSPPHSFLRRGSRTSRTPSPSRFRANSVKVSARGRASSRVRPADRPELPQHIAPTRNIRWRPSAKERQRRLTEDRLFHPRCPFVKPEMLAGGTSPDGRLL